MAIHIKEHKAMASVQNTIFQFTDCQDNIYIFIHDWHLITGALRKH